MSIETNVVDPSDHSVGPLALMNAGIACVVTRDREEREREREREGERRESRERSTRDPLNVRRSTGKMCFVL